MVDENNVISSERYRNPPLCVTDGVRGAKLFWDIFFLSFFFSLLELLLPFPLSFLLCGRYVTFSAVTAFCCNRWWFYTIFSTDGVLFRL